MFKGRWKKVVAIALLGALLPLTSWGATVEELRQELASKRQALKEAEKNISQFQNTVQLKKREARTLADQIDIIEDNIQGLTLNLDRTKIEVEKTGVQIEEIKGEIEQREEEIAAKKQELAAYLRSMHELDQQSSVTIFLKYDTFSDAWSEAATIEELQNRGQEALVAIQQLREELDEKRRDLEDYKQTLDALVARQQKEQGALANQRDSKQRILDLTQEQEKKYQQMLQQARTTHEEAQQEIGRLDTLIREELRKQGLGNLPHVGTLSWPINPIYGISCPFRCSGYPYAYLIGPHSGTDMPTNVGTPVKATADGYVARVHDANGPGYSYVMLLHGDNLTTVYGHLSGFAVNEGQMVTRGTVIGYSGGALGMRGAGLSTGAHLHFEVRLKNIPVDAQKYLGPEPS